MKGQTKKLVPPDGGWGWMACLGNSLINISLRSLDPSFGLLFGDMLKELNVTTVGGTLIIGILESVVNFSGMFVGPAIKKFGCRKIGIIGACLSCTGLILTSQANSVAYIICTYSVLGGIGIGFAMSAGFVSLHSYFIQKRTQAVGLSMAGTTLGMMCMPQIVHLLLIHYNFRGAVLIIGGLALHSVLGSCLLQPVSWHLVPDPDDKLKSETLKSNGRVSEGEKLLKKDDNGTSNGYRRKSTSSDMSSVDLSTNSVSTGNNNKKLQDHEEDSEKNEPSDEQTAWQSAKAKIIAFFDLDLLTNITYLNTVIGVGLFSLAESNFKMITPFFLASIGMVPGEIAFCLSLTAFADVVTRLTMPMIFGKLKLANRKVFWVSSFLVGISRSTMAQQVAGKILMANLIFNGFLRGITLTNLNLSVTESCPPSKVPSALGMLMVFKGLFVAGLGPVLGHIRDLTGSYQICIHSMTASIMLCTTSWGIEFAVKEIRKRMDSSSQREVGVRSKMV
ncbi:monocarboxylate transporter 1-like isoform X1 [Neodiprion fabricii]|uniref:monocarboxylate transporter 1-like isoform X1 n=2 Tax=Neodiprion fabricii TaxID=2872261 RepID=UPI001ED94DAF|nr:monocarboxylate transporter 1-like isoform X1 [Neodiprion fabricii]